MSVWDVWYRDWPNHSSLRGTAWRFLSAFSNMLSQATFFFFNSHFIRSSPVHKLNIIKKSPAGMYNVQFNIIHYTLTTDVCVCVSTFRFRWRRAASSWLTWPLRAESLSWVSMTSSLACCVVGRAAESAGFSCRLFISVAWLPAPSQVRPETG